MFSILPPCDNGGVDDAIVFNKLLWPHLRQRNVVLCFELVELVEENVVSGLSTMPVWSEVSASMDRHYQFRGQTHRSIKSEVEVYDRGRLPSYISYHNEDAKARGMSA